MSSRSSLCPLGDVAGHRYEKGQAKKPDLSVGIHAAGAGTSAVIGAVECRLDCLQLVGCHLARLVVADHFVAELLPFHDVPHSGALDGRDMNEDVGAAVVRLDEAEALGGVEPFYCAGAHVEPLSLAYYRAALRMQGGI